LVCLVITASNRREDKGKTIMRKRYGAGNIKFKESLVKVNQCKLVQAGVDEF
jgi:hypothetical protein